MTNAIFNIGDNKAVLREETTDGRYVKMDVDYWFDTNTAVCDDLTDAGIVDYLERNQGVGMMVEHVQLDS